MRGSAEPILGIRVERAMPSLCCPKGRRAPERGHATVFMIAVVTVALTIVVALVQLGVQARSTGRAQAVADLAALAAVRDPGFALAIARANGGRVRSIGQHGEQVTVVVSVGRAEAEATAEPDPGGGPIIGSGDG